MIANPCILAIDQGTTSSRAIIFDANGEICAVAQKEFPQIYPENGWVEHDPDAIWDTTLSVCKTVIEQLSTKGGEVAAIGVTNQRETTLVWDRDTDKTVYNAIVWQDRRTADFCSAIKEQGAEDDVQQRTGLLLDPYFSASKIRWILDNVDGARAKAQGGKLAFGTIDTFLMWRLTGGKTHATDATNASRTSLYNIEKSCWDAELLELFDIPQSLLPDVRDSNGDFGMTDPALFGKSIPIFGVAGDQQAAAIGQACFNAGDIKSTYGTGCFVVLNTGSLLLHSKSRLLSTIAYQIDGAVSYALEGSIFIAGAGVQWLRDELGIVETAQQTEEMAQAAGDDHGVYVVPAFTGLGAPHWRPEARGAIFGLTRASGDAAIARAVLEAVCYQTYDLFKAMGNDGVKPAALKVDGGMVANDWLCGFLADILNLPVDRPTIMETTALGAAFLAGQKSGVYGSFDEIAQKWKREKRFTPSMDETKRIERLDGWHRAVKAAIAF